MKEPGQIAWEALWEAFDKGSKWPVPVHDRHWRRNDAEAKARWAAVEAACRAEGMREAARIVKQHDTGDNRREDMEARRIYERILSAIGGQK